MFGSKKSKPFDFLEFSKWPQFIGDEMLASAIIDRIAHHAIILNMNGPKGWRLEHARSKQQHGC